MYSVIETVVKSFLQVFFYLLRIFVSCSMIEVSGVVTFIEEKGKFGVPLLFTDKVSLKFAVVLLQTYWV
jgi:hypothetical protein